MCTTANSGSASAVQRQLAQQRQSSLMRRSAWMNTLHAMAADNCWIWLFVAFVVMLFFTMHFYYLVLSQRHFCLLWALLLAGVTWDHAVVEWQIKQERLVELVHSDVEWHIKLQKLVKLIGSDVRRHS